MQTPDITLPEVSIDKESEVDSETESEVVEVVVSESDSEVTSESKDNDLAVTGSESVLLLSVLSMMSVVLFGFKKLVK